MGLAGWTRDPAEPLPARTLPPSRIPEFPFAEPRGIESKYYLAGKESWAIGEEEFTSTAVIIPKICVHCIYNLKKF